MREAYPKPFKLESRGTRDNLYWKKGSLRDVCSDNTGASSPGSNVKVLVDILFSFEKKRKAFRKVSRASFMEEGEPSSSFLAVFDAIISEEIDSFKLILQEWKDGEQYIGEQELIS